MNSKQVSYQYKSKEWLRQQYSYKSIELIGHECGCSRSTIYRWLVKHRIKIFTKARKTVRRRVKYPKLQDAKWLKSKYVEEKFSTEQIAEMVGSSSGNVRCALQYANIPIRNVADGILTRRQQNYPELWDKEWLLSNYEKKQRTILSMADEIGCAPSSVTRALDRNGIKRRTIKEVQYLTSKKNKKGENAGNWQGGRRLFKKKASKNYRYIYTPEHPNATKDGYVFEHRLVMEEKLGRILDKKELVHHKNGDSLDNRPENLEVVSKSQHVKNHFRAVKDVVILKKEIKRLKLILDENGIKY